MDYSHISFIGGGRIVRILLHAFESYGQKFDTIKVYEKDENVLLKLQEVFPEIQAASLSDALRSDLVFFALHPPMLSDLLDKIDDELTPDATFISLAPKISINQLSKALHSGKIVRMIPTATSFINEGFCPVAFSTQISGEEKKAVLSLLHVTGQVFETDESKLGAYVIASAMLPTYFWYQMQEIKLVAQQSGLSDSESRNAVCQSLIAAAKLFNREDLSYDELTDLIPAKPMSQAEPIMRGLYKDVLPELYKKVR